MSTLNENILKVKETFEDIASAIEEKGVDVGECDSPVTYADKIRSISGSAEGSFDIDKLYVEAYETDAPEPSASVSPTEDGGVMITFGLRRGATGPQGPQGEQGPAGADGTNGKDGLSGADGKSIVSTTCEYGLSVDENTEPDTWTIDVPELVQGMYLWTRTTWTYSDETSQTGYTKTYISKDGEQGPAGTNGIDGNGIVSITKLFAVNNDPVNYPTDGWTTVNQVSTSPDNRYMWCQETTEYTNTESTVIYYIVAVEGEPGATGTGNDAPIIYPAGVWSVDKEYVAESSKVPYVFYAVDGKYYILNYKHLITGEGEGSIWTGDSCGPETMYEGEPIWIEIESFEAIYSDIGLFNQALVGKWVFHGDYMFSQQGKDDLGAEKWYYDYDDPASAISNGDFIPNICMNTVDGSAYFAGFTIDKDGFSYSKDGQFAHISSTGIKYSNSDANSYFELDNNGNATFSSGSVKFNGNGSGSINNGTLEWDETGNIIKCNLYSKEMVSGEDYYTPMFGPNTTHYLFVNSADNSLIAVNLPDLDENVLTAMGDGVYYGTLVITNRKTNDLEVTMKLTWDEQDYSESVTLKPGRSVRINYFNDFQDYHTVQGFIEQSV